MTTTATSQRLTIADDRRRDPRAAALRAHLARPAGRRLDRLAAGDGLRARALGKEVRVVNADPAPAPLHGVSRRRRIEIAERVDGRRRRRDRHGVRRPGAHRRRAASSAASSSTSTTTRATPMYGAINWFDESAAACGEMVFDLVARARRAADARDRDAHLPGDPDRHRLVPLLEHLAADVRHLPADGRGRRRSGRDGAARLRQQQHRPAEAVRRGAGRDGDRLDAAGSRSSTSIDEMLHATGGTYEDTEGLINLPLTARRSRRWCSSSAADGDIRVSMRSKGDIDIGAVAERSAAAATRTPPASASPARWPPSATASSRSSAKPSRSACRQTVGRLHDAAIRNAQ